MSTIRGSSELVIRKLDATAELQMAALEAGLSRGLQHAAAVAQREYLSGPRSATTLQNLSGRLRNAVVTQTRRLDNTIRGYIGNAVKYAAFHEFGFHGVIHVKAHTRVVATLDARGESIDTRRAYISDTGQFLGWRDSRSRAAKRSKAVAFTFTQNVKAHTRKLDYAGRPFIKPALDKSMDVIKRELNAALANLQSPPTA